MQRVLGVIALCASLAASGCLFLSGGSGTGKATFTWSFAGTTDCTAAGVSRVRVTLRSGTSTSGTGDEVELGCDNAAHEVGPLREGEYTITLEGLNNQLGVDYSASRTFVILAGDTTNLGIIDLQLLYGVLLVDWAFDVPGIGMAMPTQDCGVAGVDELQLFLDDAAGNVLTTDLLPCNEPIEIADIDPGHYWISIDGYTDYNGNLIQLYQVVNHEVDVTASVQDLGAILLSRRETNFGNMAISYTFEGGGTCETNNVDEVIVEDFQEDIAEPVATFRYECPATMSTLTLTVPGNHRVAMRATGMSMGSAVAWSGSTSTNVAPGQTQNVPVVLHR